MEGHSRSYVALGKQRRRRVRLDPVDTDRQSSVATSSSTVRAPGKALNTFTRTSSGTIFSCSLTLTPISTRVPPSCAAYALSFRRRGANQFARQCRIEWLASTLLASMAFDLDAGPLCSAGSVAALGPGRLFIRKQIALRSAADFAASRSAQIPATPLQLSPWSKSSSAVKSVLERALTMLSPACSCVLHRLGVSAPWREIRTGPANEKPTSLS